MKNNKILLIATLILSILAASCQQDLLDIEQKSVIDQATFYANANDQEAIELMANVYRECFFTGANFQSDVILNALSDDNWFSQDNSAVAMEQFDDFTVTADNEFLSDIYSHYYQLNYYANLIVENVPNDSDVKNRVIAEAKAVRAWAYIELIRYWGTPPLVDRVMSSSEAEQLTNGNPEQLWNYVETSLIEAAAELPSKASKDGQAEIGARLTKEACYALLAKAYLYQEDYQNAETYLKLVIDSDLYDLVDVNDLYHPAADFSAEYLWEFNANDVNTNNYTVQNTNMRTFYYNWRSDKLRMPDQMVSMGWGFGTPTKKFGEFIGEFDVTATGERSARAKTLITDIDNIYNDGSLTFGGSPIDEADGAFVSSAPLYNSAGYFRLRDISWAEDMFPTTNLWNTFSMTNRPYMRYAEVLLMYAEVCLYTGSEGGLDALNEVRERAGVPTLGSYDLDDVKDERRAELYWEAERFCDLVRWGDAASVLADEGKVHYQLWGYKEDGSWDVRETEGTNPNGFKAGKNELLPFPASEIYSCPGIIQNSEY